MYLLWRTGPNEKSYQFLVKTFPSSQHLDLSLKEKYARSTRAVCPKK